MVNYYYTFALAGLAAAVPLNINLGAYSPALVVGDGEISFGGNQDVSELMNALEGAAVNAAGQSTGQQGASEAAGAGASSREGVASAGRAEDDAVAAAAVAATTAVAEAPVASATRASANPVDPALQEQAQQIAALQGMGKEIAPRAPVPATTAAPRAVEARDLEGFDRALRYAEAALTKGPKIQLGTGAEGSGVGIIVENNVAQNQEPVAGEGTEGAAAEAAALAARDISQKEQQLQPQPARRRARRSKVTTMYVRSGIPDIDGSSGFVAREAPIARRAAPPAVSSKRDAIDAVNLNVDGAQGVTMTFVETSSDPEEEKEEGEEAAVGVE